METKCGLSYTDVTFYSYENNNHAINKRYENDMNKNTKERPQQ